MRDLDEDAMAKAADEGKELPSDFIQTKPMALKYELSESNETNLNLSE
jgi:hypothetical protein